MNVAGVECVLSEWEPGAVRVPPRHYFTADQLLSAQRAAWNAAMEAAAEAAEGCSRCHPDDAELIASAIRSLKEPDHE